jgi:hypothetical protein
MPERRFLLVEITGPWSRDAVAGSWPERSRISAADSAALAAAADEAGVRLLAIRRPGRNRAGQDDGTRVWGLAGLDHGPAGLVWGTWTDGSELLKLDLAADLFGEATQDPGWDQEAVLPPGSALAERPVALVCTHGGRDACCAVLGRPVLAALEGRADLDVWECSHVGGHRFAGNLLMLPSGLLYGRVDAGTAGSVADAEVAGRLRLPLLRGRCGMSGAEQAAEVLARTAWDDDRENAVVVLAVAGDDQDGWRVRLRRSQADGPPRQFVADLGVTVGRSGPASCGKSKNEQTRAYQLVALTET